MPTLMPSPMEPQAVQADHRGLRGDTDAIADANNSSLRDATRTAPTDDQDENEPAPTRPLYENEPAPARSWHIWTDAEKFLNMPDTNANTAGANNDLANPSAKSDLNTDPADARLDTLSGQLLERLLHRGADSSASRDDGLANWWVRSDQPVEAGCTEAHNDASIAAELTTGADNPASCWSTYLADADNDAHTIADANPDADVFANVLVTGRGKNKIPIDEQGIYAYSLLRSTPWPRPGGAHGWRVDSYANTGTNTSS